MLYDRAADSAVRTGLWRQVVALAQSDPAPRGWRLSAVWLALPGLRRTSFRIADRLGVDREDAEAELVTAYLETLQVIGPDTADPGSALLRSACTKAWNAARRARVEVAVEDVDAVAGTRYEPDGTWQMVFDGPDRHDGLAAALRITVPADRAEGVRIGALAQEWGLTDTVADTHQLRRGRRVGALSLRTARRRG
ncbi:hypothetical protein ACH427_23010 [Streptomyces sp. NPDC020379]|uniref:hypothetical protein n=1 Tax=Streptomyces sp. NPDC020379 TaxID=3365071 RepID=UPI0037BC20BB